MNFKPKLKIYFFYYSIFLPKSKFLKRGAGQTHKACSPSPERAPPRRDSYGMRRPQVTQNPAPAAFMCPAGQARGPPAAAGTTAGATTGPPAGTAGGAAPGVTRYGTNPTCAVAGRTVTVVVPVAAAPPRRRLMNNQTTNPPAASTGTNQKRLDAAPHQYGGGQLFPQVGTAGVAVATGGTAGTAAGGVADGGAPLGL